MVAMLGMPTLTRMAGIWPTGLIHFVVSDFGEACMHEPDRHWIRGGNSPFPEACREMPRLYQHSLHSAESCDGETIAQSLQTSRGNRMHRVARVDEMFAMVVVWRVE